MLYTDWASPSMYDTLAQNFQELLAGKKSPADVAKASRTTGRSSTQTLK